MKPSSNCRRVKRGRKALARAATGECPAELGKVGHILAQFLASRRLRRAPLSLCPRLEQLDEPEDPFGAASR